MVGWCEERTPTLLLYKTTEKEVTAKFANSPNIPNRILAIIHAECFDSGLLGFLSMELDILLGNRLRYKGVLAFSVVHTNLQNEDST